MQQKYSIVLHCPRERNLSRVQKEILSALVTRLEKEGLSVVLGKMLGTIDARFNQIQKSQGCVVLAFSQWTARRLHRNQNQEVIFPSEFAHVSATIAMAAKRPVLTLREKQVRERGVLRHQYVYPILEMPNSATADWLKDKGF
jgi:hypothetical protein